MPKLFIVKRLRSARTKSVECIAQLPFHLCHRRGVTFWIKARLPAPPELKQEGRTLFHLHPTVTPTSTKLSLYVEALLSVLIGSPLMAIFIQQLTKYWVFSTMMKVLWKYKAFRIGSLALAQHTKIRTERIFEFLLFYFQHKGEKCFKLFQR